KFSSMKVALYPLQNNSNKYITILKNSLEAEGVEFVEFRRLFKSLRCFLEVGVVHLNWYENLNDKSNFGIYKSFFMKVMKLLVLKFTNKRVICTVHNLRPHDS